MYCMAMNVSIKQPVNVDTKTKAMFIVYQVCLMFTVKYSSRDLQHTPAHCMIVLNHFVCDLIDCPVELCDQDVSTFDCYSLLGTHLRQVCYVVL